MVKIGVAVGLAILAAYLGSYAWVRSQVNSSYFSVDYSSIRSERAARILKCLHRPLIAVDRRFFREFQIVTFQVEFVGREVEFQFTPFDPTVVEPDAGCLELPGEV